MTSGIKTTLFPVTDLAKAKAIFSTLLGLDPQTDAPYYVGYDVADQHIGLVPNGHANGMTGPVNYWPVDDIAVAIKGLVDAGAELRQEPSEVGGGRVVATLVDADGNPIGLMQDAV